MHAEVDVEADDGKGRHGQRFKLFFCSRSLHVTGVIRGRGPSLETVAQGSFAILPNKHGNSNHRWMSG